MKIQNIFKIILTGKSNSFPRARWSGWGSEIKIVQLIVFLIFTQAVSSYSQAERKFIRQGNSKFSDGKYPDSEISYRKAIDKNKMSQDAVFNLGDALYKQKKYEEAGKQFTDNSGATIDKKKKANSYFNLGNSLFSNNKLEESIEAYKNSLRLNPGNKETKYNLAYAQDMLKRQQEQQKQNQNKEDKNKDKNKDRQNKDQNKDKKQDQKQDQNKDQKQQQQPQDQQKISKEDAQRLLDALANDEKKVQEKVKLEKAAKERVRTIINW